MTQVGPTFSSKLPCKKEAEGDLTTWWGGGGPVIVTDSMDQREEALFQTLMAMGS